MKKLSCLFLLFLVTPFLFSQNPSSSLPRTNRDYVKILSAEPSENLTEGETVTFQIEVEYELSSAGQGMIMVGFNTYSYDSYSMVSSSSLIIEKERARVTLTPSVTIKDWGPGRFFQVYVNLSPYPHGDSWSPLSSDTRALKMAENPSGIPGDPRRWALALTGIISRINGMNLTTLNSHAMTEEGRNAIAGMLKRDWNITGREELLGTIKYLEDFGQSAELNYILKIIEETAAADHSIFSLYNRYQIAQREYNYYQFVYSNLVLYNQRDLKAWDLGRIISLCRWGYDCGYLEESEAWEKILFYARKIQPLYASWREYGVSYSFGRIFWASGFGQELDYMKSTDTAFGQLLDDGGTWSTLPWNVNLGAEQDE